MDVLSFPPSRLAIEGAKVPDLQAKLNRVIDFHDGAAVQGVPSVGLTVMAAPGIPLTSI